MVNIVNLYLIIGGSKMKNLKKQNENVNPENNQNEGTAPEKKERRKMSKATKIIVAMAAAILGLLGWIFALLTGQKPGADDLKDSVDTAGQMITEAVTGEKIEA